MRNDSRYVTVARQIAEKQASVEADAGHAFLRGGLFQQVRKQIHRHCPERNVAKAQAAAEVIQNCGNAILGLGQWHATQRRFRRHGQTPWVFIGGTDAYPEFSRQPGTIYIRVSMNAKRFCKIGGHAATWRPDVRALFLGMADKITRLAIGCHDTFILCSFQAFALYGSKPYFPSIHSA